MGQRPSCIFLHFLEHICSIPSFHLQYCDYAIGNNVCIGSFLFGLTLKEKLTFQDHFHSTTMLLDASHQPETDLKWLSVLFLMKNMLSSQSTSHLVCQETCQFYRKVTLTFPCLYKILENLSIMLQFYTTDMFKQSCSSLLLVKNIQTDNYIIISQNKHKPPIEVRA